jgi:hypothetical protein
VKPNHPRLGRRCHPVVHRTERPTLSARRQRDRQVRRPVGDKVRIDAVQASSHPVFDDRYLPAARAHGQRRSCTCQRVTGQKRDNEEELDESKSNGPAPMQ